MFGAVALAKVSELQDAEGPLNFSPDVHRTRFWQTHFGVSSASVFDEEVLSWVQTSIMESCAAGCFELVSSYHALRLFQPPTG